MFNNLAPWGEKKFVSELKRTYKFQRGVNNNLDCHATARNDVKRHTEDNSPKYRMVGKIYQCLTNVDKRLRNKCAMTCFGNMSQNSFTDTVFSRFTSYFSLRKTAFTLAEVLITLGIIGVVAAMTMPSLIQNHKEKETVVKLKKINSTLQNAYNLMRQEEFGGTVTSVQDYGTNNEFVDTFTKYLKVQKVCHVGEVADCFDTKTSYKTFANGLADGIYASQSTSFILNDGTVVILSGMTSTSQQLFVDLNGKNPPNALGKDVFSFIMNTQKLYARGVINLNASGDRKYDTGGYCTKTGWSSHSHNGLGCTAWVIYMENMDYIRK